MSQTSDQQAIDHNHPHERVPVSDAIRRAMLPDHENALATSGTGRCRKTSRRCRSAPQPATEPSFSTAPDASAGIDVDRPAKSRAVAEHPQREVWAGSPRNGQEIADSGDDGSRLLDIVVYGKGCRSVEKLTWTFWQRFRRSETGRCQTSRWPGLYLHLSRPTPERSSPVPCGDWAFARLPARARARHGGDHGRVAVCRGCLEPYKRHLPAAEPSNNECGMFHIRG